MSVWAGMGAQAGGGAIGSILDLAFGGIKNRRNEKIANRQRDRDEESQKRMANYNYDLAMKKFQDTGYEAQTKQMKEAGLNIGLMYGGAGSPGQATASTGSGASQTTTVDNTSSTGMGMQLGLQSAMMEAQIKNIEADTATKLADATNKGVQTDLGNINIELQKIMLKKENETIDDYIDRYTAEAKKAIAETKSAIIKSEKDEATKKSEIKILENNAIAGGIENILKETQINKNKAETSAIATKLAQGWQQLKIQDRANDIRAQHQMVDEIMKQEDLILKKDDSLKHKVFEFFRRMAD